MPAGIIVDRISRAGASANAAVDLALSAGNDPKSTDPTAAAETMYYGHRLKPIMFAATNDTGSVGPFTYSVTLNSGLGATYDVVLKTEEFTGQDWIWSVQDELPGFMILPKQSTTVSADALDFHIDALGAGVTTYATIYFEVV